MAEEEEQIAAVTEAASEAEQEVPPPPPPPPPAEAPSDVEQMKKPSILQPQVITRRVESSQMVEPEVTESYINRRPDLTLFLAQVQALNKADAQLFFEKLEAMGKEPPIGEGGTKMITYAFLDHALFEAQTAFNKTLAQREEERLAREAALHPVPAPLPKEEDKKSEVSQNRSASKDSGSKKSADTGADVDEDVMLTEKQKRFFLEKLVSQGYDVPRDARGLPKITKNFLDRINEELANEIWDAADENYDESSYYSSSTESEHHRKASIKSKETSDTQETTLNLRLSKGVIYVTNEKGEKITFEEMLHHLRKAYSDTEIHKEDERSKQRDAALRAAIREDRRHEERDSTANFKRVESLVRMHEMAMRFIPKYNPIPEPSDPVDLIEKEIRRDTIGAVKVQPATEKRSDFVHLLQPKDPFSLRQFDSYATFTSTIERQFSVQSMRGSMISTHLSDMPSTFSQALYDEPSEVGLTPSRQKFDISLESRRKFMEGWLKDFMSGMIPRNTFTIRIINMVSRRQVELRVCKHYTMNQVCHLYMQYEDHPEYYVWKDIYGRILHPQKTLTDNGLVRADEVLEFQGYRRLPVILLYFKDGFENEPPLPLNPLHALKQREPALCRNY